MWVGGDLLFLVGLILALWVWLRAEEVEGRRVDARLDLELQQQLQRDAARPPV